MAGLAGIRPEHVHRARDLRVLIVSHRAFMRRVQSDMLALSGIVQVESRTGGIAAVEAPADDIGLILCGYDMPQGDGLWLLKKIRTGDTAYRQDVPFVFVTDTAERWLISSAVSLDADGYVLLPASRQKVDEVVQLALRRARPQRDRDEYQNTSIDPPSDTGLDRRTSQPIEPTLPVDEQTISVEPDAPLATEPTAAHCFGVLLPGARLLALDALSPGMVLGADLLSEKGAVLLPKGAELTGASVRRLRSVAESFGFEHVPVAGSEIVDGH